MRDYVVEGKTYGFSYPDLKEKYKEILEYTDEEFLEKLPEILHLACFVSWVKQDTYWACADTGIVHELIHLLHIQEDTLGELENIRNLFKEKCRLF